MAHKDVDIKYKAAFGNQQANVKVAYCKDSNMVTITVKEKPGSEEQMYINPLHWAYIKKMAEGIIPEVE